VSVEELQVLLGPDLRARERLLVRLGVASPKSMHLIPPKEARRMKVKFPTGDALDRR